MNLENSKKIFNAKFHRRRRSQTWDILYLILEINFVRFNVFLISFYIKLDF